MLSEVLDTEITLDVAGDGHETASESAQHERLRALSAVVDSAGGRGNELLASILYDDDDRIYEVVRANGRHAALADNYRDLLTDEEAARFDAVRDQLELLPPSELEKIADFDMTAFNTELITTAIDSLYNHRDYLARARRVRRRHAPPDGRRTHRIRRSEAEQALRNTWLLLLVVGALTGLLVVFGSAATLLPLRRLTRRAEAISAGNIVVEPLPVRGSNDIRSLTRTTNEMTALLGEVEHEIHRLADGDLDTDHAVDLPGTIGESIQGSMNRLHDITRQLQRSEQLASAIVAGAADTIWTIDEHDVVLTANDASERLIGLDVETQQGRADRPVPRPRRRARPCCARCPGRSGRCWSRRARSTPTAPPSAWSSPTTSPIGSTSSTSSHSRPVATR